MAKKNRNKKTKPKMAKFDPKSYEVGSTSSAVWKLPVAIKLATIVSCSEFSVMLIAGKNLDINAPLF